MTDKRRKAGEPTLATATQLSTEVGSAHVVGLENLRVHLYASGPFWVAQGLEIDYVAQGDSPEEAKRNFQDGLSATLDQNIKAFGTIEPVLQVAPKKTWEKAVRSAPQLRIYWQISVHESDVKGLAPWYSRIEYLSQATAA